MYSYTTLAFIWKRKLCWHQTIILTKVIDMGLSNALQIMHTREIMHEGNGISCQRMHYGMVVGVLPNNCLSGHSGKKNMTSPATSNNQNQKHTESAWAVRNLQASNRLQKSVVSKPENNAPSNETGSVQTNVAEHSTEDWMASILIDELDADTLQSVLSDLSEL